MSVSDPVKAGAVDWSVMPPEEAAALQQNIARRLQAEREREQNDPEYRRLKQYRHANPLRIAFAENELPGGAAAVAIWRSAPTPRRLIIFAPDAPEEIFLRAMGRFIEDEEQHSAAVPGDRMLRLFSEPGRPVLKTGAEEGGRGVPARITANLQVNRDMATASAAATEQLAGIGRIRYAPAREPVYA